MSLELRNPHSVLAALETRPQEVVEIRLLGGGPSRAWADVVNLAGRLGVRVRQDAGRRRGGRAPRAETSGRTGGAEATLKERSAASLESLFADVAKRAGGKGLWIALDCLQDPHNVGAVFRVAAFYDVQGIVVTKNRSAPLTQAVYDVAAGGLEYVPFSVETNLTRALQRAKDCGLWILGTSEHADQDVSEIETDRPWLLVLGNEERGLRRLTREACDAVCRLSPRGPIQSLNVSVAAGILVSTLTSGRDGRPSNDAATPRDHELPLD